MTSTLFNVNPLALSVLRASDEESFRLLVSNAVVPGTDVNIFKYSPVEPDPDNSGMVKTYVRVDRSISDVSMWVYRDAMAVSYSRVNIGQAVQFFGNTVRVDVPISQRGVMSAFFYDNGLHDRSNHFSETIVDGYGDINCTADAAAYFIEGTATIKVLPVQRQIGDELENVNVAGFRIPSDMESVNDEDFIFNQVVAANPSIRYPLDRSAVTFGEPVSVSNYALDNTAIELRLDNNGPFIGSVELRYTRHDFAWSTLGTQPYVEGPSQPTIQYMIDEVSRLTGYPVALSDVLFETFPSVPVGELETLTIFFNPNSLRYKGELTIDYRAV